MTINFENWLLQIGKSSRSAKSYSGAIFGVISKWAKEEKLIDDSLLEITSPRKLNNISKKIFSIENHIQKNKKGNGMYSAALNAYDDYLSDLSQEDFYEDIEKIIKNTEIKQTEKLTLVNARVGQGNFRSNLIEYWKGCALTGFRDSRFLIASHIKPWKDSSNIERLDSFNGLLLLPNLDKVFDLGYVSFKEQGSILISKKLEKFDVLGVNHSMNIKMDEQHQKYMAFHRDVVFRG